MFPGLVDYTNELVPEDEVDMDLDEDSSKAEILENQMGEAIDDEIISVSPLQGAKYATNASAIRFHDSMCFISVLKWLGYSSKAEPSPYLRFSSGSLLSGDTYVEGMSAGREGTMVRHVITDPVSHRALCIFSTINRDTMYLKYLDLRTVFLNAMFDDQDLGFFANFLGIFIFVLVIAYHFVMADPKYEGN
ncbi:hypothetical protein AgCh_035320 [Apium graveolens]